MKRRVTLPGALLVLAGMLVLWTSAAAGQPGDVVHPRAPAGPAISGAYEYGAQFAGTRITECPQAGMAVEPRELRRRVIDRVEQISDDGDDRRTNLEYSCFPQNETSVAFNPRDTRNLLTTQNDYRTLSQQGFGASVDGGKTWYDGELPPLSVPNGDILDASGDPVSVYDRAGVAYSSSINFNRTDDENGITVQRSTNGGFTWTRACVPIPGPGADPDEGARCGSVGDPRQPGDGSVTYFDDPDNLLNGNVPFDDKEWLAGGPRPAGVQPQCFTPVTRAPRACDPDVIGVDRLYVTWTRFGVVAGAEIMLSYSDDEGRSWSPPKVINGSAPFCVFGAGNNCDVNQFSVPTVHPTTGLLGVAFENFNTPDENQYLFVRSMDGGQTFQGPFFVNPVFDVNYPNAGSPERPDCTARGQQGGRQVLTNSCFRVNAGGNVVVDKRGDSMTSGFGDDFYLIMSDNRNGTNGSSNTDVFFFKSTDGGATWIGPTRVNTDRSELTEPRTNTAPGGNFGNDQWFPWLDVSNTGVLAGGFHDRRLDTNSMQSEWPGSRQRAGNYLAWFFGAGCKITRTETVTAATTTIPAGARECLAPGAAVTPQPTAPINPGADPVPGQGASYLGPWRNQVVSDVPHNLDYSFRAGIFMGDYNAVAFPNLAPSGRGGGDDHSSVQAVGFWTDSRNGRGSGNPTNPDTNQPGRNPACEQADVWLDYFDPLVNRTTGGGSQYISLFLVTPCPQGAIDERDGNEDGDND